VPVPGDQLLGKAVRDQKDHLEHAASLLVLEGSDAVEPKGSP